MVTGYINTKCLQISSSNCNLMHMIVYYIRCAAALSFKLNYSCSINHIYFSHNMIHNPHVDLSNLYFPIDAILLTPIYTNTSAEKESDDVLRPILRPCRNFGGSNCRVPWNSTGRTQCASNRDQSRATIWVFPVSDRGVRGLKSGPTQIAILQFYVNYADYKRYPRGILRLDRYFLTARDSYKTFLL